MVVFYVWAKKVGFCTLYFYFLTIMLILDAHSSPKKSRKCSQFYNALKAKKKNVIVMTAKYTREGREGKSGLFCTNSLIFPKNGSVHR